MYQVYYHRLAQTGFEKLPKNVKLRVVDKIDKLKSNPFAPDVKISKMVGLVNGYRLRVGDLRVVYTIETEAKIIRVWKVAPRGEVYRR